MPFHMLIQSRMDIPVSNAEALRILERDHFSCRYCGLDARSDLENALIMTIDSVIPHAHGGKHTPANLVACCHPCKTLKGKHIFEGFDETKKYVVARREVLRQAWESQFLQPAQVPQPEPDVALCAGL